VKEKRNAATEKQLFSVYKKKNDRQSKETRPLKKINPKGKKKKYGIRRGETSPSIMNRNGGEKKILFGRGCALGEDNLSCLKG